MIAHTICPLCSSAKTILYLRCSDHLLSRDIFDLCKCSDCGFVFTGQYPDEQSIGRYYGSDDYISHDDEAKGFLNRIYQIARHVMLRRKVRMVEKATGITLGRILDIGCGTGHFAAAMEQNGWYVTGIEPNIKARNFASGQFGLDVISPEQVPGLPSGSFDCITMWHVLEHFHDPFGYAAEIKRLLKPGGLCLCALPNSNSFDAVHYKEYWAAYDVPRHLWHFTPETFRVFAEKTLFQIIKIKSLPLDVFYISILSERNKGSHFPFIKGVINGTFYAIRSWSDKNKSSSLIYFMK
jgi:2-polyprenyl-3-methyl-5-hydroxy-6-metoxy-1,4-benzoquinol methylase